MHPGEAYHGDLGMITESDLVILISYSGETDEIVRLIPTLKSFGVPVVSICGKEGSTLARSSDIFLDISVEREVCPHNLAPTTSTLATLAVGDALAVALMEERDFQPMDFARFHPGGSLGRRLLSRVRNSMRTDNLPVVSETDDLREVIQVMTAGRLGLAIVMDGKALKGIITDGDLRRAFGKGSGLVETQAKDIMTERPLTIRANEMLAEAEQRMMENKVSRLVVLDDAGELAGVIQIFG
jgi:arabinose-5-phosphate isomerase